MFIDNPPVSRETPLQTAVSVFGELTEPSTASLLLPWRITRRRAEVLAPLEDPSVQHPPETDRATLAARLAASVGAGLSSELSSSLALEIVLHEIAEHACLATGATGAAIVLERD